MKYAGLIVLVLYVSFFVTTSILESKRMKRFKARGIRQKITKVKRTAQGYPTLYLKRGEELPLNVYPRDFDGYVREGDSLVKNANSLIIKIYRERRDSYEVSKWDVAKGAGLISKYIKEK